MDKCIFLNVDITFNWINNYEHQEVIRHEKVTDLGLEDIGVEME